MRSRLSKVFAAALCAACVTAASGVRADEQSDLEKGRAAYFSKNFDDADQRFRAMLDPSRGTLHDPTFIAEARMYWGATLLAMNHADDATAVFEKLLLDTPDYEPDVSRLAPSVVYFFIDVRAKMRDRLNEEKARRLREDMDRKKKEESEKTRQAKRLALLESMAGQERVVSKSSRLFALLPFGAGQFQNGDKALAWFFMGAETAAVLTASTAFLFYRLNVNSQVDALNASGGKDRTVFDQYRARANVARDVNLIAWGAFGLLAAAGIVQSEVVFVPEHTEVIKRDIPNVGMRVTPILVPVLSPIEGDAKPRGAFLGLQGSF